MVDRTVEFQSTLPGWGATPPDKTMFMAEQFQSTLPGWGATLRWSKRFTSSTRFQSTLPGWGATQSRTPRVRCGLFQSTLPGWGATTVLCTVISSINFNPRSPDGERHGIISIGLNRSYFNPRSPDGERPRKWTSSPTIWAKSSIFNTDCIADRR